MEGYPQFPAPRLSSGWEFKHLLKFVHIPLSEWLANSPCTFEFVAKKAILQIRTLSSIS